MAFVIYADDGRKNIRCCAIFFLQLDLGPDFSAFSGSHHGPPVVGGAFFEQQDFKFASGFPVHTVDSRGNDARVIQHQYISAFQEFQQVGKPAMFRYS